MTIALRERRPGPTMARWPLGDTAIPPTGRRIRITLANLNRTASMTDTRWLPALVTYTRAPEGSTATEKGVMPT